MLEFMEEIVDEIERDQRVETRAHAISSLRQLGLDGFGTFLLGLPDKRFPKLSRLLPAMASEEVQRGWTGDSGLSLLRQTATFVRAMTYSYSRITGRALNQAKVLDYGCGYGRIARLMYCLVDEHNFFGVDPWDRSIELCHEAGLTTNFLISDYLPQRLPVGNTRFDIIYAFSVFTHLSARATLTSLKTLHQYIAPGGVLVITIRPLEYWRNDVHTNKTEKSELIMAHRSSGFAFKPHNRAPIDGDITYGDTSMSLEWLARSCPEWKIHSTDWSCEDAYQRYVFLTPAL